VFFILGFALYASIPSLAASGSLALFVLFFGVILSMYGGGFATIPAYLADLFGTKMVGAIHGRLLTAWSTAGVLGPLVVGYIRQYQLDHGVPRAQVYSSTMYVLASFLVVGLICNLLVKPVAESNFMTAEEIAKLDAQSHEATPTAVAAASGPPALSPGWLVLAAWLAVGIPIVWGVWMTLQKALVLFGV
jgi:hypothetical protein